MTSSPSTSNGHNHKEIIGSCLICGEPSTGRHYGVVACLGCKTFFRRAVVQRQSTECKGNEGCETGEFHGPDGKRACRACRYKRCLQMGMTKEALQPRRDLIGRRKLARALSPLPEHKAQQSTNFNDMLELMQRLTAYDTYLRTKKQSVFRAKKAAIKLNEDLMMQDDTKAERMSVSLKDDVSQSTQMDCLQMLEWAMALPLFKALPSEDRNLLLKNFAVHNLIIESGYYTAQLPVEDVWLLSNGTCMPRNIYTFTDDGEKGVGVDQDRVWRQNTLYKQMTELCIDNVATPLRRMKITAEEMVVLKIIMLCGAGGSAGTGVDLTLLTEGTRHFVAEFRNRAISALFVHYEHNQCDDCAERFGNVLLLLSGIASAASATLEAYQVMRLFQIVVFDPLSEQLLFNAAPAGGTPPPL